MSHIVSNFFNENELSAQNSAICTRQPCGITDDTSSEIPPKDCQLKLRVCEWHVEIVSLMINFVWVDFELSLFYCLNHEIICFRGAFF